MVNLSRKHERPDSRSGLGKTFGWHSNDIRGVCPNATQKKKMSEIFQFAWAVLQHWQALLTGGLVIAALGAFERKKGKPLSWKAFRWIAIAALFAAFYMAWHDEHESAMKATGSSVLKLQVVTLIQDLKAFQAERSDLESAAGGDWHVQEQTRQLFLDRFSRRLVRLSNDLPQSLVREGRLIREGAENPIGIGAGVVEQVVSPLQSVSASL